MGLRRKSKAERGTKSPPSKLRNFAGFVRFLILSCLIMLLVGFAVFAISVEKPRKAAPLPKADGIVVLTGGTGRMFQGGQLLLDGQAERLLATGVSKSVSAKDLLDLLGVSEQLLTCCVDIDTAAEDTVGNARETAIWAAALGYEHIILVTSDYHMARAKLEITTATGGIRITPFAVDSYVDDNPLTDTRRLGLLWREYLKLLAVYVRDTGNRKAGAPTPVPAPSDAMRERQSAPKITGPKTLPQSGPAAKPDTPDAQPDNNDETP